MALQQVGSTTTPYSQAVVDQNPFDPTDVYTERDEPIVVNQVAAIAQSSYPAATGGIDLLEELGIDLPAEDWRERPMISLKDGMFEDGQGYNYGKSFEGILDVRSEFPSRQKHAWQVPNGNSKTELVYVYQLAGEPVNKKNPNGPTYTDETIFTTKKKKDGTFLSLAEFKADMAANGKEPIMKTYLEIDVLLHEPGTERHGLKRRVSVSPTSVSTAAGHLRHMNSIGVLGTHPIRFIVGPKEKHGDTPAYYPWKFEIVT